jgi:hypothetical protein
VPFPQEQIVEDNTQGAMHDPSREMEQDAEDDAVMGTVQDHDVHKSSLIEAKSV